LRLVHFLDNELVEELKKQPNQNGEVLFEEHSFIANCLKIGLTISDLKELEYKDVAKIMLCYADNGKTNKTRKANQSDWDRLAGGS